MLTPKNFNITMLGARGAGKSSVLAAIYDKFERLTQGLYLELIPNPETRIQLSDRLSDLQSSVEKIRIGGYRGDTDMRPYEFSLSIPGRAPDIKMTFRDYPGEWVEQRPDEIKNYIQESDVILWAIDAAALMEEGEKYNENFNQTNTISDFLRTVLVNLQKNEKKLILLVPIKCESYLQDTNDTNKLIKKIEEFHNRVIEIVININRNSEQLALAITCIQTLGNVRFSHIENEDSVIFVHRRTVTKEAYKPVHVEQVLYYCMPFILRRYMENLSFIDKVIHIFKGDPTKEFGAAINKLSEDRVESEKKGFKVLRGHSLFTKPSS